jgi:hypothetical protein
MIPPIEIMMRWRARSDFESFAVAGTEASVAFICSRFFVLLRRSARYANLLRLNSNIAPAA